MDQVTTSQRTYGGSTADQRRGERRAQLVTSAFDLWAERGVAGLSVRAVCTAAKLNDRYFYESFHNCDELVMAVWDEQIAQGAPALLAALETADHDLQSRTRAGVETALKIVLDDPRRHRLLIESSATEPLRRRRLEFIQAVAAVMAAVGSPLLGANPPQASDIQLATLAAVSGALELVAMWVRGELDITREHLAEFITSAIVTVATDMTR
jgi:AcrR family transcriptional regulator